MFRLQAHSRHRSPIDRAGLRAREWVTALIEWDKGRAGAQAPQLLQDNEVAYAAVFSGRVIGNPNLGATYNQGVLQPSYFSVPKGANPAQKEAAMGLLHEMSKVKNQAIAADIIPYTGASPEIETEISAEKIDLYPTSQANKAVQVLADPNWTAANAEDIERRWQEFKLGM